MKYCQRCGKQINSKWKKLCYKCYHETKGSYNPTKLQQRYGGKK